MIDIEDKLTHLVADALKNELRDSSNYVNAPYLDIEDYRRKTGKRYRMTRAQKESGLTREQAFQEYMEELMNKA